MAVINAVPTFTTLLTSITILLFFAFLATSSILNKVELQFLSRVSIGLASLMGIVSILVAPPIWRWYSDLPADSLVCENINPYEVKICVTKELEAETLTEAQLLLGNTAYEEVLPFLLNKDVQTTIGPVLPLKSANEAKETLETYYEQVCSIQ